MRGFPLRLLWSVPLVLLLVLGPACSDTPTKPEVGQQAPDFALRGLDGREVRLSDFRGKVVFLNLWATWCPPCRQEMPSMVRLYEQMQARGVEILAVSEDHDLEALRAFLRSYGVTFPVLLDPDKAVYNLYRATGVPETHLINRDGVLEASRIGPFDWTAPEVVATLERLLAR